ncbi:hypothetical protein SAMN05660900_02740 [Megasphaera cerevisiae DSM 20462]|nr:hypothetical protein SAMN05660900_02740 [Megasphaera cerevisiae DSM 20462]
MLCKIVRQKGLRLKDTKPQNKIMYIYYRNTLLIQNNPIAPLILH